MPLRLRRLVLTLLITAFACAQPPVQITVDAAKITAPYQTIWNNFGADELNCTL